MNERFCAPVSACAEVSVTRTMRAVFIPHNGFTRVRKPSRIEIEAEQRLDHFADLLSQGLELSVIAQRMGIRTARASQLLMKLRQRLGPQAV